MSPSCPSPRRPKAASVADDPQSRQPLPLFDMPVAGRRDPRPGLSGVAPEALASWFAEHGAPAYRARQVADHVWSGRATSFDEIHTLPAPLRAELAASFRLDTLGETTVQPADVGSDREGAPPPRRRPPHRVRADALPRPRPAPRACHGLHLQPGRLRRRLPVLRHRRAGLLARPGDGRDRRPGALLAAPAGGRGPPPHQRRVHGHGRAAAQRRSRSWAAAGAHRRAALRPGGAPPDDQHQRRRARASSA